MKSVYKLIFSDIVNNQKGLECSSFQESIFAPWGCLFYFLM